MCLRVSRTSLDQCVLFLNNRLRYAMQSASEAAGSVGLAESVYLEQRVTIPLDSTCIVR